MNSESSEDFSVMAIHKVEYPVLDSSVNRILMERAVTGAQPVETSHPILLEAKW
jgi:hypothetical protein